ncbi:MAG: sulfatase-like hydrolase/transferase [Candidatus Latescibacteria bacterium]|jgi:arylsulfatase|nr:sulfatase-like hydrolase/transferase [Candidatus Latescibacterota bacterium]
MSQPNILILHTDQQRFDTINALGHTHVDTPNMDRLAKHGTAFTRAFSSNPVCMAARHDLLTGVSARHHGYWSNNKTFIKNPALTTVPRLLTQSGYQTIAIGKMHHRPDREHHGWAHMHNMEELPNCRENDAYLQYLQREGYGHIRCQHGVRPLFYHVPQVSQVPEEHHGSAWVAHEAINHIKEDRDRPFFMFTSWVGPHPPLYAPQNYFDQYRDRALPDPCGSPEWSNSQTPSTPENIEGLPYQRLQEAYFASITLIDTHIGRILDALEETNQIDNTIIILMSDHGEMLGDRGGYQKHVPYEGSAHIPMIVCGPGIAQGICDTPVTTWDVSATVLETSGVTVPTDHPLMGDSLRNIAAAHSDRTIFFHNGQGRRRYVAAANRTHKFIHWYNGGEEWLFNNQQDPCEQENILDQEHAITNDLRQACLTFEQNEGIAQNVENNAFVNHSYQSPNQHTCSLHPTWSSHQYPSWTNGYSTEDLNLIANEMRSCLNNESVFIHTDPEWRNDAINAWTDMGGDATVIQNIFQEADQQSKQ